MHTAEEVFRIVYCSRNMIGDMGQDQTEQVAQILKKSRANNAAKGVTGALLYNEDYFAQVLEGPQQEIETIFERIQCDPRHGDVAVLECTPAAQRDFPEWSMAHVFPTREQTKATSTTLHRAMQEPEDAGYQVLTLLRSMVVEVE